MALEGMGGRTTRTVSRSMGSSLRPTHSVGSGVASSSGVVNRTSAPPASTGGSSGGGYDGGGSYIAAAPTPAPPPRMSLAQVLGSDFGLNQARLENTRQLGEYDAETNRLRGETERDQAVRRQQLGADLQDMSLDNAEGLAGRGLLNSGFLFQNQDRINAEGVQRENAIADLLTQFIGQRGTGRTELEARGRQTINDRINQLSGDYARGIGGYY